MITLNQQQQAAVKMVQKNHVSILTGGPGTGKTTTCKEILAWADNQGMRVACCAPSGKAAKRIQEQTEFSASTIHKLLEAEIQGDFFFFNRHDQNHIDCDMLVVDETSMVDTSLMACLLKATAPETKVLFVGDAGQLPSVQAGAVLRDMVASGVIPHTELTDIHRNSGDIVKACHKIRYGELFDPSERLDPDSGLNIRHIECSSPARIKDIVVDLAVNRLPARGYDPQTDIQVLCATNEKTEISCAALNAALRAKLNPNAAGADEISGLITGDKIINTKNESNDEAYIINGDMGFVVAADDKKLTCRFTDPERVVGINKKLNNLLLAYAITVHRFQGSEAPVVIIPIHRTASFLQTRAWLYTAISRAKQICITVGERAAIAAAIKKDDSMQRVTRLKELLCVAKSKNN